MPLIQIIVALVLVALAAWLVNVYLLNMDARPIVNIVLMLIVVGIALWAINVYIPMAGSIKAILNIVVVLATCVWVLQQFGLWDQLVRMWSDFAHHRAQ